MVCCHKTQAAALGGLAGCCHVYKGCLQCRRLLWRDYCLLWLNDLLAASEHVTVELLDPIRPLKNGKTGDKFAVMGRHARFLV